MQFHKPTDEEQRITSAYHPHSNGLAGNHNRTKRNGNEGNGK